MRWISYFILAYLIIAIQMALAGYLRWGQASPNLVLPAAVFIAINARREHALIGAFGLGFLQDLFSQHPLGLYAFAFGMVVLFVVGTGLVADFYVRAQTQNLPGHPDRCDGHSAVPRGPSSAGQRRILAKAGG